MNQTERHAIVTGGSSGIGAAVAAELAARGYRLTIIGRSEARLTAAAAFLKGRHPDAALLTLSCDVRDETGLDAAVAKANSVHGPCDALVTSAGIVRPGHFAELGEIDFRDQMDVNFFGTVAAVRAVYPAMLARRQGRIMMIASAAALTGIFGYTAYAGSKFAVRGFAEALRGEARQHGISVSVCYPADTDTPQLEEENRLKPAETRAITGTAGTWRPDDMARIIVAGMEKGDFAIYPGLKVALLGRAGSIVQPLLDRYFDFLARRSQRSGASGR